jgi:hypothetical protein
MVRKEWPELQELEATMESLESLDTSEPVGVRSDHCPVLDQKQEGTYLKLAGTYLLLEGTLADFEAMELVHWDSRQS